MIGDDATSENVEPSTGTCVSCQIPSVCPHAWPTELVPLPAGIDVGRICDACHASLVRYAVLETSARESPSPARPDEEDGPDADEYVSPYGDEDEYPRVWDDRGGAKNDQLLPE